jgi:dTDP-4-amino-4,6-dideoxygalactose transaminase
LPSKPTARLPVAKELGETSLMFMVHPTLEREYMQNVADAVREVFSQACR